MEVGICAWLPVPGLACQPPVGWLVTFGLAACLFLLAISIVLSLRGTRQTRRQYRGLQRSRPLLTVVAAILLLAALSNPVLVSKDSDDRHQVVLLVDVSDSQRRDLKRFNASLRALARSTVAATGNVDTQTVEVHLVAFADGARVLHEGISLDDLAATIEGLPQEPLPGGGDSDIETGINRALDHIDSLGGRGQVVLWSDGLETVGQAEDAAVHAGRRGVPIHTLGHVSSAPGVGIYGAYLTTQLALGEVTQTRLMVRNTDDVDREFDLSVGKNGAGMIGPRQQILQPGSLSLVPLETSFQQTGLQYVDLALEFKRRPTQHERLFAQVIAPLRVLVVGPETAWTVALGTDFEVTKASANNTFEPTDFDIVVLSGAAAGSLAVGQLERLSGAVQRAGVGLMLINGPHRGPSDATTVIGSYKGSVLEPLLPVRLEPRSVQEEPPPRQVIFVIDVSGSMADSLLQAKTQAAHIIRQLRPMDSVHIRAFSGSDQPILRRTQMTAQGKEMALRAIASLSAGGTTSPGASMAAVEAISVRTGSQCGLFFMTDGEFSDKLRAVGCLTTIFAFDSVEGSLDRELSHLGDLHYLRPGLGPRSVKLQFFEPEERKLTFEATPFVPDWLDVGSDFAPSSRLMLPGNAVTFRRLDADTAAVRPYPLDPVLAFQNSDTGTVGVFTSELTPLWYRSPVGHDAIERWLKRLAAWAERDRYAIDLAQSGSSLSMRLTLLSQNGEAPNVSNLAGRLILDGTSSVPVPLERDSELFGVFRGRIDIPEGAGELGFLEIKEGGVGAMNRPQRIPIRLPDPLAAQGTSGVEAWSFGLDDEFLRRLSVLSGGRFEPQSLIESLQPPALQTPVWPWLVTAAALAFLADICIARFFR